MVDQPLLVASLVAQMVKKNLPVIGETQVRSLGWQDLEKEMATHSIILRATLVAQMVKNLPANVGDLGSIAGWERSPGEENGNPLQYSCLENPMDRGT